MPTGSLRAAYHVNAIGNRLDARLVKREPVEKRSRDPSGARLGDIVSVGGQNRGNLGPDRCSHKLEGAVLLLGRGQRQHLGSRARTAADLAHGGGNIARSLNAFKRSRHICQKTHENPCPGALSYHVVHAPARSARPVPGRAGRGVAKDPWG